MHLENTESIPDFSIYIDASKGQDRHPDVGLVIPA
jgi:hypothetical protein